jgi:hypothetical protein
MQSMRRAMVSPGLAMTLVIMMPWLGIGAGPTFPTAEDFPAEVGVAWFNLLYDVVKTAQLTAPPASRVYGVTAVALYEAVVRGSVGHQSLVGQLNALTAVPRAYSSQSYHWPTAANSALARTVRGPLPTVSDSSLAAITALEDSFIDQFQASVRPLVYHRSVRLG